MSNAIAVVNLLESDSPKQILYELSLTSIIAYGAKIGVPVFAVQDRKYPTPLPPHLEKLQTIDLLTQYNRVVCLDLDILVNPAAPDIFAANPDDSLVYGYDEGYLPWIADDVAVFERRFDVTFPQGQGNWKRLLNGGTMIWSQAARIIPQVFDRNTFHASFDGTAGEQSWVNTMLVKHDIAVGYLDQKWNWCPYAAAAHYPDRLNAHFIHYAADGEWIGQQSKILQIQDDARALGVI